MQWENYDNTRDKFYFYDFRNQFTRYIYNRSVEMFRKGDAGRDAITSWEDIEIRQKNIAEDFIKSLGGLPPMDTPLNPQVVGTIACEGFRIEKIIFESRPHVYVTANLYIPDNISKPTGAVLFVCGHHEQAKHAEEYQIVCRHLVAAGLVVLAQDPIGQGERMSYYEPAAGKTTVGWGTAEHEHAGEQCFSLGDSISKYFVHDAMRGIDYLCTRPEVDPQKIGITGNSGGGTQSAMMMLCDRRLAAAAPATFVMNREEYMYTGIGQDAEQIWRGFTKMGYDHEDILIAMAPKPVLVLAVAYDFFPIEGTKRTVERVKRFWAMRGREDCIELFIEKCGHTYTRTLSTRAAEFFSEHLLGKKVTPDTKIINATEPSLLLCTNNNGQVKAQFPDARFVHEENQDKIKSLSGTHLCQTEKSAEWLKKKVIDCRITCDLNLRIFARHIDDEYEVLQNFWRSQEDLFSHAYTFRRKEDAEKKLPVTIAVWDGGTSQISSHHKFIERECSKGRAVMVLDGAGIGALEPYPINTNDMYGYFGTMGTLAHNLIWLDDSLPAIRTYDVIRAVDALHGDWDYVDTGDIKLYLNGRHGFYGYLAAKLDGRIKSTESDDSPESYYSWVFERHYEERDIHSIVFPGILSI